MADPRFFDRAGPFALGELAGRVGARLGDPAAAGRFVVDVAPLEVAGRDDVSFLDNVKYLPALAETKAGAVLIAEKHAARLPPGSVALICDRPYRAYALLAQAFFPQPVPAVARHPTALIDPTAAVAPDVAVGAYVVVEAGVRIGAGTVIGHGTVIARNVEIGRDCRIGPQVSLTHCLIGDRVTIHAGAKIGQDGFGFAADPSGHVKVPQLGRVVIGDACDIGANTTIDRGSGHDTVIGAGTWIDNLVQVGHNVVMGRGCILVAQSGIAGSTKLGDFVAIGAQGGVAGHLSLGTGAQLAARAGLMHDVPAGQTFGGAPAQPIKQWFRQVAHLKAATERGGKK